MRTDALSVTMSDNFVLCTLEGVIGDSNYREIQRHIRSLAYSTTVVIDMSKISSLSSTGLGAIISLIEYAQEAERRFYLMNPSTVARLFIDSTGFPELFPIINSLDEIRNLACSDNHV